jgi:cysteine synthase
VNVEHILRAAAALAALVLGLAPFWPQIRKAAARAVEAAKEKASTLTRIAAVALLVVAAWGIVPLPHLPDGAMPTIVVEKPSVEMQQLVAPISAAMKSLPAGDRLLWAQTWTKAGVVVAGDAVTTEVVFTDTRSLRAFTALALDIAWRRIGQHAPGSNEALRQAVEAAYGQVVGKDVVPVTAGQQTLKEAVNEAMRDWVTNVRSTHYILGTAYGAHPYPVMVRNFHRVIGEEARRQILEKEECLPDLLIACVGGGSNAIGLFYPFLNDPSVKMYGVEAGGEGILPERHAARFQGGSLGVLQGTRSFILQDDFGQIQLTHSVSAGLDYAAVGPEHAWLHDQKRVEYGYATDVEALDAFTRLARTEGIIPALESSHAVAAAIKIAPTMPQDSLVIVNLSGRGDKDVMQAAQKIGLKMPL